MTPSRCCSPSLCLFLSGGGEKRGQVRIKQLHKGDKKKETALFSGAQLPNQLPMGDNDKYGDKIN